jgi:hypothetical protein
MRKPILIIALLLVSGLTFAQPIPGGRPDDGGAGTHDEESMPLITGTMFLVCAGALYGTYKVHTKKK